MILALDTATPYLTLALSWPQGTREDVRLVGRTHAELLAHAVEDLFKEAQLPFYADQLVLGIGPGSYTGVRVGASYALGLSAVWNAPVHGISSLVALLDPEDGQQAVALDARKGHVYTASYEMKNAQASLVIPPCKQDQHQAQESAAVYRQDVKPSGLMLLNQGKTAPTDWSLIYL